MYGLIFSDHRENNGAIPYMDHQLEENNNKYKNYNIKSGGGLLEHKIMENMPIGDYILLTKCKDIIVNKNDVASENENIKSNDNNNNKNESESESESEKNNRENDNNKNENENTKSNNDCDNNEIKKSNDIPDTIETLKKNICKSDKNTENEQYILSAVFERKTWKDLASSIKDNRLEDQINNMKHMQDKYKCYIYFIIEGNLGYKDNYTIEGIPFKNLHAKLRSISLQGIPFIQTKNPENTAQLLINMSRDIIRLYNCDTVKLCCENLISISGLRGGLAKKKPENKDIVYKMWKSIKGISDSLTLIMMENFTFKEFFTTSMNDVIVKLSDLCYASGRKIGKNNSTKIIKNSRTEGFEIKFLENINGISNDIAKLILNNYKFSDLFIIDISKLENIKRNNRKIPKPACERLLMFLQKY